MNAAKEVQLIITWPGLRKWLFGKYIQQTITWTSIDTYRWYIFPLQGDIRLTNYDLGMPYGIWSDILVNVASDDEYFNWIDAQLVSFKKMHLKMSPAKCQPCCSGHYVFKPLWRILIWDQWCVSAKQRNQTYQGNGVILHHQKGPILRFFFVMTYF